LPVGILPERWSASAGIPTSNQHNFDPFVVQVIGNKSSQFADSESNQ
jgi:hypothetical protein